MEDNKSQHDGLSTTPQLNNFSGAPPETKFVVRLEKRASESVGLVVLCTDVCNIRNSCMKLIEVADE